MKSKLFFFALLVACVFAADPLKPKGHLARAPADADGSNGDASGGLPDVCSYVPASACNLMQACIIKNGKCTYKWQLPSISRPSNNGQSGNQPTTPKPSAGSNGRIPDLCNQVPLQLCEFARGVCKVVDNKCKSAIKIPGQN